MCAKNAISTCISEDFAVQACFLLRSHEHARIDHLGTYVAAPNLKVFLLSSGNVKCKWSQVAPFYTPIYYKSPLCYIFLKIASVFETSISQVLYAFAPK